MLTNDFKKKCRDIGLLVENIICMADCYEEPIEKLRKSMFYKPEFEDKEKIIEDMIQTSDRIQEEVKLLSIEDLGILYEGYGIAIMDYTDMLEEALRKQPYSNNEVKFKSDALISIILDMLQRQGEKLKREGIAYRWMRYDSTIVCGNQWYRHSREVGGGPIQFMKHFYGMDFRDSMKYLLEGEEGGELVQTEHTHKPKPEFDPPQLSKNMHRTFAYLIKTRGIDADIVQHFVSEKKIQETEEHHNVAFCGYDKDGSMKQMHLRSTLTGSRFFQDVDGSDKQYYFRHEGTDNTVYVFEAPIDMLSYITMNKDDWQEHSYVCLGGVAVDALRNILDNNANLNRVYLCVDRDEAGDKTVKRIEHMLTEREIKWERLLPKGKDWNEDLLENINEAEEQINEISM